MIMVPKKRRSTRRQTAPIPFIIRPATPRNNENEPQRLTFTLAGMTSVNAQNVSGSLVGQRAVRVWNVTAGETEASESAAWQIFSDYYSTKVNNKFYYFKSAFDITYVANKTEAAAAGRDTIPMYAGQEKRHCRADHVR
jgi:hypothetical protein